MSGSHLCAYSAIRLHSSPPSAMRSARSAPGTEQTVPARAYPVRSPLSPQRFLGDLGLQERLGQELLQPSVLRFQLLQLLRIRNRHSAALGFPYGARRPRVPDSRCRILLDCLHFGETYELLQCTIPQLSKPKINLGGRHDPTKESFVYSGENIYKRFNPNPGKWVEFCGTSPRRLAFSKR